MLYYVGMKNLTFNFDKKRATKRINKIIWPSILVAVLAAANKLSDTILVGNLGEASIAGTQVGTMVISLTDALMIGISIALSGFLAQSVNNRNKPMAQRGAHALLTFRFWIAAPVVLFLIIFANPLVGIFVTDPAFVEKGAAYLRVVAANSILMVFVGTYKRLLSLAGLAKRGMFINLSELIVNVITSIIFIYVFHLGVIGAALGTICSSAINCVVAYILVKRSKLGYLSILPIHIFHFSKQSFRMIAKTWHGIVNELVWYFGDATLFSLITRNVEDGAVYMAISGLINSLGNNFATSGTGQLVNKFAGRYIGRGEAEMAQSYLKLITWQLLKKMFILIPLLAGFIALLPYMHIFNIDKHIMNVAIVVCFISLIKVPAYIMFSIGYNSLIVSGKTGVLYFADAVMLWGLRVLTLSIVILFISHSPYVAFLTIAVVHLINSSVLFYFGMSKKYMTKLTA